MYADDDDEETIPTWGGGGGGAHCGIGGDGGVGKSEYKLFKPFGFANVGGLGALGFCEIFGLMMVGILSVGAGGTRLLPLQSGLSGVFCTRLLTTLRFLTGAVPMVP